MKYQTTICGTAQIQHLLMKHIRPTLAQFLGEQVFFWGGGTRYQRDADAVMYTALFCAPVTNEMMM